MGFSIKSLKRHLAPTPKQAVRQFTPSGIRDEVRSLSKLALLDMHQSMLRGLRENGIDILEASVKPVTGLFSHGFKGGIRGTRDALAEPARAAGREIIDIRARSLDGVVSAIEALTGARESRKLSAEEIAELRKVYGDSIDYDAVRIERGGIMNNVKLRSHTVDNTVWLDDSCFDAAGQLNAHGVETLVHEMAHVWQYQNRGPGYLADALMAQAGSGVDMSASGLHQGSGDAYDWVSGALGGKSFDELNPEQQAELAAYIHSAIRADGILDLDQLRRRLAKELSQRGVVLTLEMGEKIQALVENGAIALKQGKH